MFCVHHYKWLVIVFQQKYEAARRLTANPAETNTAQVNIYTQTPPPPPQINQPSLNTLAFQQQDVCMLFCSPSLHLSDPKFFLLFQITVNVTLINFCVFSASAVFSLTRSSEIIKICCSINICYYYYDVENSRVELFSGFFHE